MVAGDGDGRRVALAPHTRQLQRLVRRLLRIRLLASRLTPTATATPRPRGEGRPRAGRRTPGRAPPRADAPDAHTMRRGGVPRQPRPARPQLRGDLSPRGPRRADPAAGHRGPRRARQAVPAHVSSWRHPGSTRDQRPGGAARRGPPAHAGPGARPARRRRERAAARTGIGRARRPAVAASRAGPRPRDRRPTPPGLVPAAGGRLGRGCVGKVPPCSCGRPARMPPNATVQLRALGARCSRGETQPRATAERPGVPDSWYARWHGGSVKLRLKV